MPANSTNILSQQVHDGDSGTQTVTGDKYKGDGYYGRSDGIHTIQYTLAGFIGTINIQATLAVDPADADWFTVYTSTFTTNETSSNIENITGNYVWIRATVADWTDGSIESIVLNH